MSKSDKLIELTKHVLRTWTMDEINPSNEELKTFISEPKDDTLENIKNYINSSYHQLLDTIKYYQNYVEKNKYTTEFTDDVLIEVNLMSLITDLEVTSDIKNFENSVPQKINFYQHKQAVDYLNTWDFKDEYLKEISLMLLKYSISPTIENVSHIINNIELARSFSTPTFHHIDYTILNSVVSQFAELWSDN